MQILKSVSCSCSKGKTTLLKHIANRALSIPPNIDVLLCEQGEWLFCYTFITAVAAVVLTVLCLVLPEVVADDTPAVQAVLKADTRRLKLLEEEKQLQANLEKGEDSVAERLEKVISVFEEKNVSLPWFLVFMMTSYQLPLSRSMRS